MIRFIILFIVAYVLYRSIKSWMFQSASSSKPVAGESGTEIDDVMIKDPYCESYFPKRTAVHLNHNGEDLFFCSDRCKDKYLVAHSRDET
jgi:YHS domain-containing protein